MTRNQALTPFEVEEAKRLRSLGYTKKLLAKHFGCGATTIWDNVYRVGKKQKREIKTYRGIKMVVTVVGMMKAQGLNTLQVAQQFNLPLKDVNYIYSHHE